MSGYPLEEVDLSDLVAADQLVLEEVRILGREVEVSDLVKSIEPQVTHLGDVIGGLTEEQANDVLRLAGGVADTLVADHPAERSEQQEIAVQAFLRGVMVASRAAKIVADRAEFAKRRQG